MGNIGRPHVSRKKSKFPLHCKRLLWLPRLGWGWDTVENLLPRSRQRQYSGRQGEASVLPEPLSRSPGPVGFVTPVDSTGTELPTRMRIGI